MKNVAAMLVTGLAILTFGMPSTASAQGGLRQLTAEVMNVNRDAQALTVKSVTPDGREVDNIFSVQEAAAPVLANLRPGETVRIAYVRVNGQLRAERIERVAGTAR